MQGHGGVEVGDQVAEGVGPCLQPQPLRLAVLAGDALLTQAFEILVHAKGWRRYSHQKLMAELEVTNKRK